MLGYGLLFYLLEFYWENISLEVPIDAVFITEAVLKDKNTREEE